MKEYIECWGCGKAFPWTAEGKIAKSYHMGHCEKVKEAIAQREETKERREQEWQDRKVITFHNAETVEELKDWIDEYVLTRDEQEEY